MSTFTAHKMAYKTAKALRRLLERVPRLGDDADLQEETVHGIGQIMTRHVMGAEPLQLGPECAAFALPVVNAITIAVRRWTDQLDVASSQLLRACSFVLVNMFPAPERLVALALVRGDFLALLARAFACTCVSDGEGQWTGAAGGRAPPGSRSKANCSTSGGSGNAGSAPDGGSGGSGDSSSGGGSAPAALAAPCTALLHLLRDLAWLVKHNAIPELRAEVMAAVAASGALEQAAAALLRLTARLNAGAPASSTAADGGGTGCAGSEDGSSVSFADVFADVCNAAAGSSSSCSSSQPADSGTGPLAAGGGGGPPGATDAAAVAAVQAAASAVYASEGWITWLWRQQQACVEEVCTCVTCMLEVAHSLIEMCASWHRFAISEDMLPGVEGRRAQLEKVAQVVCGPAVQLLLLACADPHGTAAAATAVTGSSSTARHPAAGPLTEQQLQPLQQPSTAPVLPQVRCFHVLACCWLRPTWAPPAGSQSSLEITAPVRPISAAYPA